MPLAVPAAPPRPRLLAIVLPAVAIGLAALVVRTPLAAAHPLAAALFWSWVVADSALLGLLAGTDGRPTQAAILARLAGAGVVVWAAAPIPIREMLSANPACGVLTIGLVAAHLAIGAVRAHRLLRQRGEEPRLRLISALSAILPPALVRVAAAELAIIHIALLRWGGAVDVPPGSCAFGYHRHLAPISIALLVLSSIEIGVGHLVLMHFSRTAALVLMGISLFGLIYLVGLIKSFRYRPILLGPTTLRVRAGFLIDVDVPHAVIASVDTGIAGEVVRAPGTLNAALLAWPNVVLHVDPPVWRHRALRTPRSYDRIAFRVDDPAPFLDRLRYAIAP
ncbi:hypothetical protein F1C10_07810 [Sphingomonas sp. NBWT7]|uniref:hypothetical protein n=1 Tax=Sphingomonas sp. NBWT7 TaxID=2596913 RepID=UPI001625F12B|nr:hypothetical protein [Sphingomonas sp. NBWT7]QNE31847.1 hypothetical protein F1C10_07810 [Sphingomonas sp. NBWT7]